MDSSPAKPQNKSAGRAGDKVHQNSYFKNLSLPIRFVCPQQSHGMSRAQDSASGTLLRAGGRPKRSQDMVAAERFS